VNELNVMKSRRVDPKLVRLGLSTWSWNERMIQLVEKQGLKKEAIYRD
jgi:RimJ/RimL family protein N-acetyltransferase